MTVARGKLVDETVTPWYHCVWAPPMEAGNGAELWDEHLSSRSCGYRRMVYGGGKWGAASFVCSCR